MYVLHEWLKLHIKIFNGYKYNYIGLTELLFFSMDSVNVQIYEMDIGKLIFVKKKY